MKSALVLGLVSLLTVAACGSDSDSATNTDILRTFAASAIGTVKPEGPPAEQMTRARLAEILTPVMLVAIDKTGQEALIAEIETNGGVATWSSVDDITISLRNGVIVATRGFGADLMSAAVPNITRNSAGGSPYSRIHVLLNGEDQPVRTAFSCTLQNAGLKAVEVVQISYQVTHLVESCGANGVTFQNDYWFSGDQNLRKSRQWISPDVGYLTIADVRR